MLNTFIGTAAAALTCAAFLNGCSVPEKTVTVDSKEDLMRVTHATFEGPDVRVKLVNKAGEVGGTIEKKGGKVTLTQTGKAPETRSLEQAKKELGEEDLKGCRSNLTNLATASDMWCSDHSGRYPDSPSQLTPDYLKQLPVCPATGKDCYSESYRSALSRTLSPFLARARITS